MRVIAKRTLRQFWEQYPDAKGPLEAWHEEALKAHWETPQQIKAQFRSASILKGGRVVFNIGGNKYRLILAVDYGRQAVYVKFVGTHRQYDAIDAETV
jgi:mRNA interferase HigB